jgi:WD40 repeat protein
MNSLPPCLCNRPQKSTWLKMQCSNCLGVLKESQAINFASQSILHFPSQDSFSGSLFELINSNNRSVHKRSCTDKSQQAFVPVKKVQERTRHILRNPSEPLMSHKANYLSDAFCFFRRPETMIRQCRFVGHKNSVNALAIAENKMISGGQDYYIRIWDLPLADSGTSKTSLKQSVISFKAHSRGITGLGLLNPDSFLSSSLDNTVKMWGLSKTLNSLLSFKHVSPVKSLSVHGSGFVSGSSDSQVSIWDIQKKALFLSYSEHLKPVSTISSFKSSTFLTGSEDSTIKMWDSRTIHSIASVLAHSDTITSVKALDLHLFMSSSIDKTVKIWDIRTMAELTAIDTDQEINSIEGSKDLFFVAGKTLQVWHKGVLVDEQAASAKCLKASSSLKSLLIGSYDCTSSLYKITV